MAHEAAGGHDGNGVGQKVRLVHEVRRQQQRAVAARGAQQRPQALSRHRVHACMQ